MPIILLCGTQIKFDDNVGTRSRPGRSVMRWPFLAVVGVLAPFAIAAAWKERRRGDASCA